LNSQKIFDFLDIQVLSTELESDIKNNDKRLINLTD